MVLSDADTVAPALVATAVAGTSKVIEADGLMLRAVERAPGQSGPAGRGGCAPWRCCRRHPATRPVMRPSCPARPPGRGAGAAAGRRHRRGGHGLRPGRAGDRRLYGADGAAAPAAGPGAPLASFFSRRLRWSLAGIVGRCWRWPSPSP
ncbi:hypothetical protein O1L44_07410 [Streptomyces noursei]|nr:hypothetical protein [Streptomyces noursei]